MALIKNIETLQDLFVHTLQDIYYAEKQLLKAIPKILFFMRLIQHWL